MAPPNSQSMLPLAGGFRAFMTKVVAAHGRAGILVNNAGVTRYQPFLNDVR